MNTTRQRDSKAVLVCPQCNAYRYVNQEFLDVIAGLEQLQDSDFKVEAAIPRHKPCNALMEMAIFPDDIPPPITPDDLDRIFIRAQNSEGRWASIDCKEATDEQFDTWAKTRIEIKGDPAPWSLEERADFCDRLYLAGALHLLKKDIDEGDA